MTETPTRWKLSKNKLALLIIGAAIAILFVLRATKPDAQLHTKSETTYTVRTQTVSPGPLAPSLSLYGTVEAPGRARLSAAISADVSRVHALAGDHFDGESLLIELDAAEAEISLNQARAQLQQADAQLRLDSSQRQTNRQALAEERDLLKLARRALERAEDLRRQGVLSDADVDAAQQNLKRQSLAVQQRELAVEQADAITLQLQAARNSAEAQMQRAELDLQRTRIHAPFNAAVLRTHVAAGDRVNPGTPLIELYDLSRVEIRAQIPNRHINALLRAQRAAQTLKAKVMSHGATYTASFVRLASSGSGGGQDGYFRLDNAEALPVDAKVTLQLQLPEESQAVALPFTAIYDLSRIFRVRDGRLQSLNIEKLGDYLPAETLPQQHLVIRAAELAAGDEVVITQLPNAITGLKVQAISN